MRHVITVNQVIMASTKLVGVGRSVIDWENETITNTVGEKREVKFLEKGQWDALKAIFEPEIKTMSGDSTFKFPVYKTKEELEPPTPNPEEIKK